MPRRIYENYFTINLCVCQYLFCGFLDGCQRCFASKNYITFFDKIQHASIRLYQNYDSYLAEKGRFSSRFRGVAPPKHSRLAPCGAQFSLFFHSLLLASSPFRRARNAPSHASGARVQISSSTTKKQDHRLVVSLFWLITIILIQNQSIMPNSFMA